MSLNTLFQRFRRTASGGQGHSADTLPMSQSDVEASRVQARRRLIGMVVLVGAGVIGFPWLFETQPRPMSPDVQILQAPTQAGAESAVGGVAAPTSPRSVAGKVAVAGIVEAPSSESEQAVPNVSSPQPREQILDEPAAPAEGKQAAQAKALVVKPPEKLADRAAARPANTVADEKPAPKTASRPAAKDHAVDAVKLASKDEPKALAKEALRPAAKDAAKPPAKPASKELPAAKPNAKAADKASGKPADKNTMRYVVQFGAFADVNTAHEARMKVERLGIKTYAQQVTTPAGKRIRVRVGPFADKAEADKAMAALRKAGLAAAVLTL